MQSLWGCAYEKRSLGDVNYKITVNFELTGNYVFQSLLQCYNINNAITYYNVVIFIKNEMIN
jgi:hypothetical protein